MEAAPGFEPGMRVLQTRALPLGYTAVTIEKVPKLWVAPTARHSLAGESVLPSARILVEGIESVNHPSRARCPFPPVERRLLVS